MLEKYDVVQARWECVTKEKSLLAYFASLYAEFFHIFVNPMLNTFKAALITGNGVGIKKEVFNKVKFNEEFIAEDFKFSVDCCSDSISIFFDINNFVYITQPISLSEIEKQLTRWAYGGIQLYIESFRGQINLIVPSISFMFCIFILPLSYVIAIVLYLNGILLFNNVWIVFLLYIISITPSAISVFYYLNIENSKRNLKEKLFSFIICSPIFVFFYIKGALKYFTNKKYIWVPTEKIK
jgi:cellulose synthase/poly-beta-1,6-N-acetylglucosamine synthase-like glycosyltransferase